MIRFYLGRHRRLFKGMLGFAVVLLAVFLAVNTITVSVKPPSVRAQTVAQTAQTAKTAVANEYEYCSYAEKEAAQLLKAGNIGAPITGTPQDILTVFIKKAKRDPVLAANAYFGAGLCSFSEIKAYKEFFMAETNRRSFMPIVENKLKGASGVSSGFLNSGFRTVLLNGNEVVASQAFGSNTPVIVISLPDGTTTVIKTDCGGQAVTDICGPINPQVNQPVQDNDICLTPTIGYVPGQAEGTYQDEVDKGTIGDQESGGSTITVGEDDLGISVEINVNTPTFDPNKAVDTPASEEDNSGEGNNLSSD